MCDFKQHGLISTAEKQTLHLNIGCGSKHGNFEYFKVAMFRPAFDVLVGVSVFQPCDESMLFVLLICNFETEINFALSAETFLQS